jgi:hypothetical protein
MKLEENKAYPSNMFIEYTYNNTKNQLNYLEMKQKSIYIQFNGKKNVHKQKIKFRIFYNTPLR